MPWPTHRKIGGGSASEIVALHERVRASFATRLPTARGGLCDVVDSRCPFQAWSVAELIRVIRLI